MPLRTSALIQFPEIADKSVSDLQVHRRPYAVPDFPVTTDFYRSVYCVLGLPIDAVTVNAAADMLENSVRDRRRCFLSTPNLNFLIGSLKDPSFRDSVIRSDLSVADGMPLVWIARLMGIPIKERVAGSTLFERIGKRARRAMSVYFFGGPDGAAAQAAAAVNAQYSGIVCVGSYSPGFGTVEEMSQSEMIRNINESRPDFLVVAMGAKKGQAWIERNLNRLGVPIVSHLGAVVNMVAGSISRAPSWMQKTGLEWLWRIKEEPSLWRRYLFDGMAFLKLIATRVVPCMIYVHGAGASVEELEYARATVVPTENGYALAMRGAWSETNLGPLRKALMDATRVPGDVVVDLEEVSYLDGACIALFVLLYGHQSKIARRLHFRRVSPSLEKALKLHGADYLLSPEGDL